MNSQEYRDLVIRDAGEQAKNIIQNAFDESNSFFEALARLKKRQSQIEAYNMLYPILRQIIDDCSHENTKILAFEQLPDNTFVYLKQCQRCCTDEITDEYN